MHCTEVMCIPPPQKKKLKCLFPLVCLAEPKVENIRLRAHMACLRGLAMHYVPEHREEAILHLEQAVKLNCTLWKAWVALGDCYYEMGDMEMCRGCMEYALRQVCASCWVHVATSAGLSALIVSFLK